jgi:hypothetical protein
MRGDLESVFLFPLASVEMDICFLMSMSVHSAFFFFLGNSSFCYDHGPITLVTTEMGCQQIKTSVVHTPSQVFFFLWLFGSRLTSLMPKIHGVHSICSSRGGGVGSVSLRS